MRSFALLLSMALAGTAPASPAAEPSAGSELEAVLGQPVYGSSRLAGASKLEQDAADAPTLAYVRTGGEIRAQGYRTLAEVLESMPGVHLRSDRTYQYTGVRGISRPGDYSSRLLLLIDGVRVNDAIYDSATGGHEFPLDVALIDRVEYIPGPGSALYGSNAELGVVNVVTRGPSQLPGLRTGLELGSGALRRSRASWGGDLGPARVLIDLSSLRRRGGDLYYAEFDRPETNRGVAVDLDAERADRLFAKARWADFAFVAAVSDRWKSEPTAPLGSIFNAPSSSTDRYAFADLSFSRSLGGGRELFARLGLNAYDYIGRGTYGDAAQPVPSVSRAKARSLVGELRHVWALGAGHRLLAGAEFQRNHRQQLWSADLEPAPMVYTDLRLASTRWALFADDEWQARPDLRLNLGLRLDRRLDGRPQATPRLALRWSPDAAWTFKLQHGQAFREPNISETTYTDASQRHSPALRVEGLRANQASLAWRPRESLELSATAYSLRIRDMIDLVAQDDGTEQYENRGRSHADGVELEATWSAPGGVQLRGSVARQHARDPDAAQPLSDAPRTLAKLMLTLPGPWAGSRFGANALYTGARATLAGASLAADTRLNMQFTLAPPGQPWSVGFGMDDVFDRRGSDPASQAFIQDTLARDGRTWRVQFGWAY